MKKIELEDIAVIFATEFVKETTQRWSPHRRMMYSDFLKMSFARRKKICSRVIDKILEQPQKSS